MKQFPLCVVCGDVINTNYKRSYCTSPKCQAVKEAKRLAKVRAKR